MNTMIKRIMTLVASIALSSLFAVQVSAAEVSVPITFESAKTASVASAYGLDSGVDGTNTALTAGIIGAVFSISTECAADINTVKISSNYTATHVIMTRSAGCKNIFWRSFDSDNVGFGRL